MKAVCLISLLLAAAPAEASPPTRDNKARTQQTSLGGLFREREGSALLIVPVVDVDPNRGVTAGAAPTWFLARDGRARAIHAPFASYNSNVGLTGGYDFYLFPTTATQFEAFGTISQRSDREALLEYRAEPTDTRPLGGVLRAQHLRDGSRRYYGVGPHTQEGAATDYTLGSINASATAKLRLAEEAPWLFGAGLRAAGVRILPGPSRRLPDVDALHPGATGSPRRKVDAGPRFTLAYETLDTPLAPNAGASVESFVEAARKGWLSDFTYLRYGLEAKSFTSLNPKETAPHFILALHGRVEMLDGEVPFWLMPSLGGKRSHRGYGDGRFVDGFMTSAEAELRTRVYRGTVAGAPLSLWTDPFLGLGTVAADAGRVEIDSVKPLYGVALRAVSRPQVVVSLDIGAGLEGPKVFLDLTYAF